MDSGGCHHFPGENGTGVSIHVNRGDFRRNPILNDDPRVPLSNLSVLRQRMDSLQLFLSQSVGRKTLLGKGQMDMVNAEITSAIQQIIVNGTALLAFSQSQQSLGSQIGGESVVMNRNEVDQAVLGGPVSSVVGGETVAADLTGLSSRSGGSDPVSSAKSVHMSYPIEEKAIDFGKFRENQLDFKSRSWNSVKIDENLIDIDDFRENQSDFNSLMSSWEYEEVKDGGDSKEEEMKSDLNDGGCEVVEIDAVELLAEHVHFCDICGKGFKRDANLRMHMRAHGNQFKTPEALAKPDCAELHRKTRFSCPYVGCNRNKSHKKFQPLKSVICVKNHFKRSHCPKMYSCNRCHKKSFSVVSDLKSHFKHCGESKWRCSCGTTFSRKDKLFGHLALFEGHMPEEDEKSKGAVDMDEDEEKVILNNQLEGDSAANGSDLGFFDGLFDGFGGIDNNYLKDVFGSPLVDTRMGELYDLP